MSKINLITVVVREKESGTYEHSIAPGDALGIHRVTGTGAYLSAVWGMLAAVRVFNPHVAFVEVTPWYDGGYQIILNLSPETAALIKAAGLDATEDEFFAREWPSGYDFTRIVAESEVDARLETLQALVDYWNEHLC